jgi:hypothetical protein
MEGGSCIALASSFSISKGISKARRHIRWLSCTRSIYRSSQIGLTIDTLKGRPLNWKSMSWLRRNFKDSGILKRDKDSVGGCTQLPESIINPSLAAYIIYKVCTLKMTGQLLAAVRHLLELLLVVVFIQKDSVDLTWSELACTGGSLAASTFSSSSSPLFCQPQLHTSNFV